MSSTQPLLPDTCFLLSHLHTQLTQSLYALFYACVCACEHVVDAVLFSFALSLRDTHWWQVKETGVATAKGKVSKQTSLAYPVEPWNSTSAAPQLSGHIHVTHTPQSVSSRCLSVPCGDKKRKRRPD